MPNATKQTKKNHIFKNKYFQATAWIFCGVIIIYATAYFISSSSLLTIRYNSTTQNNTKSVTSIAPVAVAVLDKVAYDAKLLQIANVPPTPVSPISKVSTTTNSIPSAVPLWPVKGIYPIGGALLPFNRIVAYYGNFYSTKMGILGEYPPQEVLRRLQNAVDEWKKADPSTPVIPAIDYVTVTAQSSPGADNKYRARMPADQIQKAIALAEQINGIVILDVQVGKSNVQTEIPLLEEYLKLPQVELALDPEFSMKNDRRPGTIIGTMDATDINYTANYLASLVKKYNLPPKVLIVHRFTENMVTNYKKITPLPEVQIVMDMDGWSTPEKKIHIYNGIISNEPVQFTGIKLFYKTDLVAPTHALLTPKQILELEPQPSFIQYQ
ncbi:MAG: hypothetical protein KGI58_01585 [Patescibacteria group bacterium]|nr:hypothetical protein [Patescibacteria group bacterium]